MEFAKKMMKKYGWAEGEGLGKNKTGINKPLNAHLKFDTTGLGVDQAAEFNNHWWQRVYNQAANNIKVKTGLDQVSLHTDESEPVEISTKDYSIKKLKSKTNAAGYNFFLKSATLTNLGSEIDEPNKIEARDLELPKFNTLTDEELFAACGGRTAHKGARHGLNLTGKLERLKEQEEKLLEKMSNTENLVKMESHETEWTVVANKKKKKVKEINSKMVEDEDLTTLNEIVYKSNYINKSKKKKKNQKEIDNHLSNKLVEFDITEKSKITDGADENNRKIKLSNNSKNINKNRKYKNNKLSLKSSKENSMDFENEKHFIETVRNILDREESEMEVTVSNIVDNDKNDLEEDVTNYVSNKKIKKLKNNKMKCKDKIIAKKIKKTINVLDNLDTFLKVDKSESDN